MSRPIGASDSGPEAYQAAYEELRQELQALVEELCSPA